MLQFVLIFQKIVIKEDVRSLILFIFLFIQTKSKFHSTPRRNIQSPFRAKNEWKNNENEEDEITFYFPDDISSELIDFLNASVFGKKASIIYNEIKLLEIYKQIVEKFLDINLPMTPFEETLNDKELHIVLQNLCWLMIYDMTPKKFISHDLLMIHRSVNEKFSMHFAQIDKRIKNSTIILSGKFMELWSTVISASFISFLLSVFPNSILADNVSFVVQIENYVSKILVGCPPQNMKVFHKSVFGLIIKEVLDIFPKFITINEPEAQSTVSFDNFRTPTSKKIIRNSTEKKAAQICGPQNSKQTPRKCSSYDKSGIPIAQAYEVYKKVDNIIDEYKVERQRQLFDICAQEELYIEAKEVPPITPLGITFEDFPKPHLPPDYYNPRNPRRRKEKHVRRVRKPKNGVKRRYRIIPEPEETMATIAKAHEYLTENPVYLV